jgi:branched-chain amino acid transport system permease protein
MATVINLSFGSLVLAAIFALVNAGFVMLFRTTGVLNFAQGYFMLLGAYLMAAIVHHSGFWFGLLITLVGLGVVGYLAYLLLMRFTLTHEEFTKVVASLMLASLLAQVPPLIWGTNVRLLPPAMHGTLTWRGARISVTDVLTIVAAVIVVIVVVMFLDRTVTGVRMQAQAGNPALAIYSGIRVHRLSAIAWATAAVLGGLAGVAYAERTSVNLDLATIGLAAFPAAVIGGLASLGGTLVGGLIVAVVLTVSSYLFGAVTGDMLAYALMLGTLIVFPTGLFGHQTTKRL